MGGTLTKRSVSPTTDTDFPTVRKAAERARIGERAIRAAVRRGELALYRPDGTWPRIYWPELVSWVRASRVRATPHAEARLAEVLEREGEMP